MGRVFFDVDHPRLYETIEHFCLGRRHLEKWQVCGGLLGMILCNLKVKELAGARTYSCDTIVTIVTRLYQSIYRSIYDRFDVIDVIVTYTIILRYNWI